MEASIEHRGVRVRWDPSARVAQFEVDDDRAYTAEAADAIIPVFERWVRPEGAPYGILVDARRVTRPGSDWRMRWAQFHHADGGRARIAIVQPNLFVRTVLASYGRITGTPLRAFPTETAARGWLADELRAA